MAVESAGLSPFAKNENTIYQLLYGGTQIVPMAPIELKYFPTGKPPTMLDIPRS